MKTNYLMICSLIILFLFTGCSNKNKILTIENHEKKNVPFLGLIDIIEKNKNTNIFFIHGMNGYNYNGYRSDPHEFANKLKQELGIESSYKSFKNNFSHSFKPIKDDKAVYIYQETMTYKNKNITIYALDWSYITEEDKYKLIKLDDSKYRTSVTENIKSMLINKGFSDVLMYVGKYKNKIQNDVLSGYLEMQDKNPNSNNIIISFSLGSSIVVDFLNTSDNRLNRENIDMIYFLSNQIPLINTSKEDNNIQLSDYLSKKENKSEIKIISFTDPNDLLSYPIDSKSIGENLKSNYVNITISIADKTYYVPFYKEKTSVVNYMKAHLFHIYNKKLMKLIFHGNKELK